MKKFLLGGLVLLGIASINLPVMARVTSTSRSQLKSDICAATKTSAKTRCDSTITIADSSLTPANTVHVCSDPQPEGYARCNAVVAIGAASPNVNLPTGYGPSEFLTAYQLTGIAKNPAPTIAIIDAYDNPNIESELNTYSATYGLPACTTANGCFTKVNQRGVQNSPPAYNSSWGLEIALDVEIAHAICQNCKILLIEADNNFYDNLGASVNEAVTLGATVVSNSYGGPEFYYQTQFYDPYYNHPGVAIVASSGDNGYGVQFPAASPYVTAVGGTSLYLNPDKTRNSETVWSGSGSGCSLYETKPKWQPDKSCTKRTVADVSADADPSTGAAVYYQNNWLTVGGTSLAAPLVAGVYALGGVASYFNGASHIYTSTSVARLYRVKSGNNGSCNISYFCAADNTTAPLGYNGPTGFGTPMGSGGF